MNDEDRADELGKMEKRLGELVAESLALEESIKAFKTRAGGVSDDTVLILG